MMIASKFAISCSLAAMVGVLFNFPAPGAWTCHEDNCVNARSSWETLSSGPNCTTPAIERI
jgi:hypothetical protein